METLKKIFPFSWKYTNGVSSFILGIIMHLVAAVVVGLLIKFAAILIGWIPVVGLLFIWLLRIASSLLEAYIFIGIVLQILVFAKIIDR